MKTFTQVEKLFAGDVSDAKMAIYQASRKSEALHGRLKQGDLGSEVDGRIAELKNASTLLPDVVCKLQKATRVANLEKLEETHPRSVLTENIKAAIPLPFSVVSGVIVYFHLIVSCGPCWL